MAKGHTNPTVLRPRAARSPIGFTSGRHRLVSGTTPDDLPGIGYVELQAGNVTFRSHVTLDGTVTWPPVLNGGPAWLKSVRQHVLTVLAGAA